MRKAVQNAELDLRLVPPVRLDLGGLQADLAREVEDRFRGLGLRDFDVAVGGREGGGKGGRVEEVPVGR